MGKRIGILGGTFDPPHIGHLIIADEILQAFRLEEVRFMPNHLPPHKKKDTDSTDADRLNMLRLATQDHPFFKIETIELERKGISYTHDTMRLLKAREPDAEFFFIIGADMAEYLPKWHKIDELVKLVQFIVVNRPGHRMETDYPVKKVNIPDISISSSVIRAKIEKGESVRYLLPRPVWEYIKEKGLYGSR